MMHAAPGRVAVREQPTTTASSSDSFAPESRPPLYMGYGEKFGPRFVRPEHEVVRESAEPRPAQARIERLETARSGGDEFDSAIQLIQEPVCRAQTALGVPCDGFLGIPHGGRMKADCLASGA